VRYGALIICWLLALCPVMARAEAAASAPADSVDVCLPGYCMSALPAELADFQVDSSTPVDLDAYASGDEPRLHAVNFQQATGPLTPDDARYWLGLEDGAPFDEDKLIAQGKCLMGLGVLSSFEWAVLDAGQGEVNLDVWYSSRKDEAWLPIAYYDTIAGLVLGAEYRDMLVGGKDRQLLAGTSVSFDEGTDEPSAYVEWTDQTVNNGRHSLTLRAETRSDWRQRLRDTEYESELRQRLSRFEAKYRLGTLDFAGNGGGLYLGGGIYDQDHYVLKGDPTGSGTLPRSDVAQEGSAAYVQLGWDSACKDLVQTPSEGYQYSLLAEQHFGDFEFNRFKADVRRYIPVRNIIGCDKAERHEDGRVNNLRTYFPAASIGVQAQASLADGDVPYSQEERLGDDKYLRGYATDSYVGTKVLAARAEYRFALDCDHQHEGFIFSDNAWIGEELDDMQALNSVGLGALVTLPVWGGIKAGGYWGSAVDGADNAYGLSLGYAF
jgi:hypothetical protein